MKKYSRGKEEVMSSEDILDDFDEEDLRDDLPTIAS